MFLPNVTRGGFGAWRGDGINAQGDTYCLWVLSATQDFSPPSHNTDVLPTIAITMEKDMMVACGDNAVYVYDGIPDFVNHGMRGQVVELSSEPSEPMSDSELLAGFCGMSSSQDLTVYARSGLATVLFNGDLSYNNQMKSRNFDATYEVFQCPDRCGSDGNRVCVDGQCVCEASYVGEDCKKPVCPQDCGPHGQCHHGVCVCLDGFDSNNYCVTSRNQNRLHLQLLSSSQLNHFLHPNTSLNNLLDETSQFEPPTSRILSYFDPDFVPDPTPRPNVDELSRWESGAANEDVPSPRAGHTLTSCHGNLYLFGGYSPTEGLLDDMWMFNISAKTWVFLSTLGVNGPKPTGRYHHAAACIPQSQMMYVFGGFVNEATDRVETSNEMWSFNTESGYWTKHSTPQHIPRVAGHSLTYVDKTSTLWLIGGFSSQNYLNDKMYQFNYNSSPALWKALSHGTDMSGTVPTGLYGHSAVYHSVLYGLDAVEPSSHTIYIYGGYKYHDHQWKLSSQLYTFDILDRKWGLLAPDEVTKENAQARAFHSAVNLEDDEMKDTAMVVIGGLTSEEKFASDILVYRYICNTWHRLSADQEGQGDQLTAVASLAATTAHHGRHIYVFGGFSGLVTGSLFNVSLPIDICADLHQPDCSKTMGCQWCGGTTR